MTLDIPKLAREKVTLHGESCSDDESTPDAAGNNREQDDSLGSNTHVLVAKFRSGPILTVKKDGSSFPSMFGVEVQ